MICFLFGGSILAIVLNIGGRIAPDIFGLVLRCGFNLFGLRWESDVLQFICAANPGLFLHLKYMNV